MKLLRQLSTFILFFVVLSGGLPGAGAAPAVGHQRIAILLFDRADIIDFSAPYDVFVNAEMDVFTVSADGKPITTAGGMKVSPDYSFANAPAADAVVIPGGETHRVQTDDATLEWIRQRYGAGDYLLSVCNGAFILANTGLLKGLRATTTAGNIDALRRLHPDLRVAADARVVDNGRIITTGGLSAGIDGALHMVARLTGKGKAQFVAQVMEYNWLPEGSFLPATHGFRAMHQTIEEADLAGFGHVEQLLSTSGDASQWSYAWLVRSNLDSASLAGRIDQVLARERKEMQMNPPYSASPGHSWVFADTDGQAWTERLEVATTVHDPHLHVVRLGVVKR